MSCSIMSVSIWNILSMFFICGKAACLFTVAFLVWLRPSCCLPASGGFDPFHLGDLIACAGPIGLLFGRITNFINGELYGRVTDVGRAVPRAGERACPVTPASFMKPGWKVLLLFTVLWALVTYTPALKRNGSIAGLFIIGYALSRIVVEFVREPDAQLGFSLCWSYHGPVAQPAHAGFRKLDVHTEFSSNQMIAPTSKSCATRFRQSARSPSPRIWIP